MDGVRVHSFAQGPSKISEIATSSRPQASSSKHITSLKDSKDRLFLRRLSDFGFHSRCNMEANKVAQITEKPKAFPAKSPQRRSEIAALPTGMGGTWRRWKKHKARSCDTVQPTRRHEEEEEEEEAFGNSRTCTKTTLHPEAGVCSRRKPT